MTDQLMLQGSALEVLQGFDDEFFDCIITSPPYWGLRDYGVDGQLGLEKTFQEYVEKLVAIFTECKRVLKPSGTCWVNLGDTYGGSGNASGHTETTKNLGYTTSDMGASHGNQKSTRGMEKCLLQIPSRFAIAMSDAGWILRNEIIWYKRNAMPSSAKDRFTVDFEKLFFFTKNKKYWFEQQREGDNYYKTVAKVGTKRFGGSTSPGADTIREDRVIETTGRNKRTVWDIPTKPFKGAHFAVFPTTLVEPMLSAGCPFDGWVCDPFAGSGTAGVVCKEQDKNFIGIELNQEYCDMADKRIG